MQKKLRPISGCSLCANILTLQSMILMKRNFLVATEIVVSGPQCTLILNKFRRQVIFYVQGSLEI